MRANSHPLTQAIPTAQQVPTIPVPTLPLCSTLAQAGRAEAAAALSALRAEWGAVQEQLAVYRGNDPEAVEAMREWGRCEGGCGDDSSAKMLLSAMCNNFGGVPGSAR